MYHGSTFYSDTHHAALEMDLGYLRYLIILKRTVGTMSLNCFQAAADELEGALLHVSR